MCLRDDRGHVCLRDVTVRGDQCVDGALASRRTAGARRPVSTVDLVPTLIEAAGLSVPEGVQGRSFLPLVGGGDDPGRPDEVFVQISESHVGRALRTARWKYAVAAPDRDPWEDPDAERYVETELYDLWADPHERDNLAGLASHRDIADRLAEALRRWMIEVGEAPPVIEPAPVRDPGVVASTRRSGTCRGTGSPSPTGPHRHAPPSEGGA
ncbi:sulfatase/phosphatase domain-containing protein [Streptomyces sp. NPDC001970]